MNSGIMTKIYHDREMRWHWVPIVLLVLSLACNGTQGILNDDFGRSHVVVQGQTLSPASLPLENVELEFEVFLIDCSEPPLEGLAPSSTQTGSDGRFSVRLELLGFRPQGACLSFSALPPPNSGLRSTEGFVEDVTFVDESVTPDTVNIDILLQD